MTSVDQAVLAIREIAQSGNEEQAFQDTQALFFQLVRDNVIFIMPSHTLRPDVFAKRAFRPYMAPLEGEQEKLQEMKAFRDAIAAGDEARIRELIGEANRIRRIIK